MGAFKIILGVVLWCTALLLNALTVPIGNEIVVGQLMDSELNYLAMENYQTWLNVAQTILWTFGGWSFITAYRKKKDEKQ